MRVRPYLILMRAMAKLLARFCFWILFPVVGFLLYLYLTIWRGQSSGPFRRSQFEAIVAQVRALHLPPGEKHVLEMDDLNHPEALRLSSGGSRPAKYRLWVRGSSESFTMVIETSDMGHAGHFGFAYSDDRLEAVPDPNYPKSFLLAVPGPINQVKPDMRIDDHWWKVYSDLD